ncbi:MAG: hypothetical protein D6797_04315 [Bdellovibrio sp.]|nr:MAG: hypothetical protein D6797_04315 [Bdellovibrio sp.]
MEKGVSEFITLPHRDPKFIKYLKGQIEGTRAIPLKTFFLDDFQRRCTTFQVIPAKEIIRPSWWRVFSHLLRLRLLTLTLAPLLTTLFWLYAQGIPAFEKVSAFLLGSVFFLHGAIFLFNDYLDYVKGYDWLYPALGSGVLQKGWMTGRGVFRLGVAFTALAIVLAIPVFQKSPLWLWSAPALALLALGVYMFLRQDIRSYWWGDLLIFCCLGPLISVGVASLWSVEDLKVPLWLGFFWGFFSLSILHSRRLRSLFYMRQHFQGKTHFDQLLWRLKVILVGSFFIWSLGFLLFPFLSFVFLSILFLSGLGGLLKILSKVRSPASSALLIFRKFLLIFHYLLAGMLSGYFLF